MAGKEYINKILYKYCFKKQIWFKKQNTFVFIIDIYNYKKKGLKQFTQNLNYLWEWECLIFKKFHIFLDLIFLNHEDSYITKEIKYTVCLF